MERDARVGCRRRLRATVEEVEHFVCNVSPLGSRGQWSGDVYDEK